VQKDRKRESVPIDEEDEIMSMTLFHALIRTHHITSRKKVAHLRKAASKYDCYALLRSGGCPGIMYCKGSEEGVKEWVGTVQVSCINAV
jgi:hypothetical protein